MQKKMVYWNIVIAKSAKLGDVLGDEGCLTSVHCPHTVAEAFVKVPLVNLACLRVGNTV